MEFVVDFAKIQEVNERHFTEEACRRIENAYWHARALYAGDTLHMLNAMVKTARKMGMEASRFVGGMRFERSGSAYAVTATEEDFGLRFCVVSIRMLRAG